MNAIPLTPLDALIWKTCRVKLNERELRALVLLLISLLNIAFALIDICFEAETRATAYQGYWSACFYLIAGALGIAASFQPSSKHLLLAALGFSALSVPLSILSFILSLSVGYYINENAGLIVISLLALGSCGIESFHLRSMLLTIENPVSAVNESLINKPSEGNIEGATAVMGTNYQNTPNPSEYSPV